MRIKKDKYIYFLNILLLSRITHIPGFSRNLNLNVDLRLQATFQLVHIVYTCLTYFTACSVLCSYLILVDAKIPFSIDIIYYIKYYLQNS